MICTKKNFNNELLILFNNSLCAIILTKMQL